VAYGAKDISILKGLQPVRERPGMYIGSTGPSGLHHLVYEVVDNSVDEALAGYANRIDVTLLADGGCRVVDNGRGIPVDPHPEYPDKSAAEIVLTMLHAGGKFGGEGYKISGGLHGVGVSVVNALSRKLVLEIQREGGRYQQTFLDGGEPEGPLQRIGDSDQSGTSVTFWPDDTIMEETEFRAQTLLERLREMAFLNKGLEIVFRDERSDEPTEQVFLFEGGIVDFVTYLNASKEPLFETVVDINDVYDNGEVEIAMQWNTGFYEGLHSFANNIATTEGGMHEEGFKKALTNVVNRYAKEKGHLKADKDENLLGEDIREGLTAIISVKLRNPQFEGQTKTKLGNTEIRSFVERATNERLKDWLEEHPTEGKAIVTKSVQAQRARLAARQARDLTRRKSLLESASMPGKLADCSTRNAEEAELFIVEGDSAGGSAKRARNPAFQAILPIRGKILNVERSRLDRMFKNEEIQALISATGTGIGEEFDIEKLRYHKIILMADADVDGSHIRTLLLTFFYRHLFEVVRAGYVYIAQPPLYGAKLGKDDRTYLKDEAALAAFEAEHVGRKIDISRFKGLGEMDWHELGETTMDPITRTLLQVSVEDAATADGIIAKLMGDDVDARRGFIQENAKDVRFLDI
jgi:DNA gyrase subunit B